MRDVKRGVCRMVSAVTAGSAAGPRRTPPGPDDQSDDQAGNVAGIEHGGLPLRTSRVHLSIALGHARRFARMGAHANERSRTRRPASCSGERKPMPGSTSSVAHVPSRGVSRRALLRATGIGAAGFAASPWLKDLSAAADEATPVATLSDTAWDDLASRLSGRLLRPGDAMYPAATVINAARYMGVASGRHRRLRFTGRCGGLRHLGPRQLGCHSRCARVGIPTPGFPPPTAWSSTSRGCVPSRVDPAGRHGDGRRRREQRRRRGRAHSRTASTSRAGAARPSGSPG